MVVSVAVAVIVEVALGVEEIDEVLERVGLTDDDTEGVIDDEGVIDGDGLSEPVGVGEGLVDDPGDNELVGVGVADGESL